jgi:protein-tyrosine sulfotransferase
MSTNAGTVEPGSRQNATASLLSGSADELRAAFGHLKRRIGRMVQKSLQRPIVIAPQDEERLPGAFIIAPFRSGTTLLRFILDSHPQIAAPPETFLFAHLLAPLRDERTTGAMWNVGFHREVLARALGDYGRGFLEAYARSKGKRFWIEKTPSHVEWLPELAEAFTDVRFLLLYRHPFDIVRSMMERDMARTQPEIAALRDHYPSAFATCCAYVAREHAAMLRFQRQHPAVVYELRYERLVDAPERELAAACAFLGVSFDPQIVRFDETRHDLGFGDEKINETRSIVARTGTYGDWSAQERQEAAGYLRAPLEALGYAV